MAPNTSRPHSGVRTFQQKSNTRKVDIRLPGKGESNSHGVRPVHQKHRWIRTSRLSIKNSLSLQQKSPCLTQLTWETYVVPPRPNYPPKPRGDETWVAHRVAPSAPTLLKALLKDHGGSSQEQQAMPACPLEPCRGASFIRNSPPP